MASFAVRTLSFSLLLCSLAAVIVVAQDQPPTEAAPVVENPISPTSRIFAATETLAVVGDQHILAGDLLGEINQMLSQYEGKAPPDELNEQRRIMMMQMLPMLVENKVLYLEFLRQIPKDKLSVVQEKIYAEFDEEKLGPAIDRAKVNTQAELDQMMRKYGMSIDKERRKFMEQKLGRAMMAKEINYKPEITHEEMLAYYTEHARDFDNPARVQWQQFTVRFSNHETAEDPTGKVGAWAKIASMGNEVLRNAKFDAVAKKHSEGSNASEGGFNNWVTRGALASDQLDNVLFTLPVNQLSQIIEDGRAYHIIRVLDREEASRTSFEQAQEDIKTKIKQEKIQKQVEAYIAKLKAKTSVWTVFDNDPVYKQAMQKTSERK